MLVSPRYICRTKRSESNVLVIRLYSQNEAEREQRTGNSLIFLFAEQSVASPGNWLITLQNEAKREQRPGNSRIFSFYSQNKAKREQHPGNLLKLYISYFFNYYFRTYMIFMLIHASSHRFFSYKMIIKVLWFRKV